MRAIRLLAPFLGALLVLYVIAVSFVPDWMIVGIKFGWPWK
jgi:hypothetical protein